MKLHLVRKHFTEYSTIGELYMDGGFICYILEDKDRDLDVSWPLNRIKSAKIKGLTAIPTGQYQILWNYSKRFKKDMPLLVSVPGFEGIRIHAGNTSSDTEGCLIPGMQMRTDNVFESREATFKIYNIIYTNITEGREVFIEISRK